jgi:hypothetical protein
VRIAADAWTHGTKSDADPADPNALREPDRFAFGRSFGFSRRERFAGRERFARSFSIAVGRPFGISIGECDAGRFTHAGADAGAVAHCTPRLHDD